MDSMMNNSTLKNLEGKTEQVNDTESEMMPKRFFQQNEGRGLSAYIIPKEMQLSVQNRPENDPHQEQSDFSKDEKSVSNLQLNVSERHFFSRDSEPKQDQPFPFNYQQQNPSKLQPSQVVYRNIRNNALTTLEVVIFMAFFVGSFPSQVIAYLDLAGNIICLAKILIIHGWLYAFNLRVKKELAYHREQASESGPKTLSLFINTVQKYEFLQIWSLLLTPFCFVYAEQPLLGQIFPALRSFRLLFIVFLNSKEKLKISFGTHVVKLGCLTLLLTLLLTIPVSLLLHNSSNHYCIQEDQMVSLVEATLDPQMAQNLSNCGIFKPCQGDDQLCRNLYEYTEGEQERRQIDRLMLRPKESMGFEQSVIEAFLATQAGAGMGFYRKYSVLVSGAVIFPISIVLWLAGVLMVGVGVGQALRSETLEDWEESKKLCSSLTAKCTMERRKSNIGYNIQKIDDSEKSEMMLTNSADFECSLRRITEELSARPVIAKVFTVVFNLFSLAHVFLVILDDLNIGQHQDKIINLILLIINVIWLLTFIVCLIQFNRSSESPFMEKGILIYEVFSLMATLFDYTGRAVQQDGSLIMSTSFMTPVSHGLISLRIFYVIFNNGVSAYCSYYSEKMIENFWINRRFLGTIFLLAAIIGFAQSHASNQGEINGSLAKVNNSLGIILGTRGSIIESPIQGIFFTVIKVLAFILGLYIAKRLNMGFDAMMDIELSQEYGKAITVKGEAPAPINCLRNVCIQLHNLQHYHYAKTVLICAYAGLSLMHHSNDTSVISYVFLGLDIYLLMDLLTQVFAFGLFPQNAGYRSLSVLRVLYLATQCYLITTFLIPQHSYAPLMVSLRLFRLWAVLPYFQHLRDTVNTAIEIILHPQLQIYKLILLGLPFSVVGMAITASFVQEQNSILQLIQNGVSFAYGLGWNFVPEGEIKHKEWSILVMNLAVMSMVGFYHLFCTFMMVSYFVNRQMREKNINEQVIGAYGQVDPCSYHHTIYHCPEFGDYIKYIKLGLLATSMVLLCFLIGDTVLAISTRNIVASSNLALVLIEVFLYMLENGLLKACADQRWPLSEGLLIILSTPGAFLLVSPVTKYSFGPPGLRLMLQLFQMFSALHLLNMFPLLVLRAGKPFTSRIMRRIYSNVPFAELAWIFVITVFFSLPFAAFLSRQNETSLPQEMIACLLGGFFHDRVQSPLELAVKIVAVAAVFLPMKLMLLARIISSFLSNRLSIFDSLHDDICQMIVRNGIIDKQQKSLHLLNNDFFRLTKNLCQSISPFSSIPLHPCYFRDVEAIYKRVNPPVFLFADSPAQDQQQQNKQQSENKKYGTFVFDLIYGLYLLSCQTRTGQNNIAIQYDSLYEKGEVRQDHVFRTPLKGAQLASLLKAKTRLLSKMNKGWKKRKNMMYEDSRANYYGKSGLKKQ